jgi:hypothetical protein
MFSQLKQFQADGRPEQKYHGSNGIAAFVRLCTDEIQKASAYMTDLFSFVIYTNPRGPRTDASAVLFRV